MFSVAYLSCLTPNDKLYNLVTVTGGPRQLTRSVTDPSRSLFVPTVTTITRTTSTSTGLYTSTGDKEVSRRTVKIKTKRRWSRRGRSRWKSIDEVKGGCGGEEGGGG